MELKLTNLKLYIIIKIIYVRVGIVNKYFNFVIKIEVHALLY